jgi:hypothetical protein
MTGSMSISLIQKLEAELSAAAAKHTEIHYRLLQARAAQAKENAATATAIAKAGAKRRAEFDDELPADATARAIVLAGRNARGEI